MAPCIDIQAAEASSALTSMPESHDYSVRSDYRLLDRDWVDERELLGEPDPAPLRAACLMIYIGLLLSLGGLLYSLPAVAQSSDYLVTQNWDVADGLEQNTVQAIARDSRGFVWVGTVDGLSRFDGRRFRNFRLMDYPELGTNRISALAATPDGTLWIGSESRGIVRFRDGAFGAVPFCDQSCQVLAFARGPDGGIWVLTPRQIFRFDPDTLVVGVDLAVRHDIRWPAGLDLLPDGRLVYFGDDTVIIHEGREFAGQSRIRAPGTVVGTALLGGRLLVATASALHEWDGSRLVTSEFEPVEVSSATARIRRLLPAGPNQLVLQLSDGSVSWISGRQSRRIEVDTRSALLTAMVDDAALWLGSRLDGLYRISPARMFGDAGYRNAAIGSVLPIVDHPEQGVLVGRLCGGVEHILADGGRRSVLSSDDSRPECIATLLTEPAGSILIGSVNGMVRRWFDGSTSEIDTEPGGIRGFGANFLFRDRLGATWLGADNGLFRVDDDRIGPARNEVETPPLRTAIDDPGGGLLIGTDRGVARFDSSGYRSVETGESIDRLSIRSIFREDASTLWFGTYGGGLWRFKDGRWFQAGPDHGLAEDVISCMLRGPAGRLWMSGNRGISLAALVDLNKLADGVIDRVHAWSLTDVDGMPDPETNGGGQPACHRDRNGWFWFPTVRGPVAFDPAVITEFEPTGRLFIEEVSASGRRFDHHDRVVELPADARDLEIRYTVPQFENAHRLRFRYRLSGSDERWIDAGTAQVARYPVVPVGRYRFEVQMGVDDGRWLDEVSSTELVLPAPGFQVAPRQLILIIAALLVLLLVFRWRISELRARDVELNRILDERTRKLREMNARLDELARTDELTGIANHRRLRIYLAEQWRACATARLPLSAIIIDVDHFKEFNDTLGHQVGDQFLRSMAQSLSRLVTAEGGLLARYGGEEFIALLPRRSLSESADIAETLRRAVISLEYSQGDGTTGFVTASFGVASLVPNEDTSPEELVRRADRAMYKAKRGGRDRVCVEERHPPPA